MKDTWSLRDKMLLLKITSALDFSTSLSAGETPEVSVFRKVNGAFRHVRFGEPATCDGFRRVVGTADNRKNGESTTSDIVWLDDGLEQWLTFLNVSREELIAVIAGSR